MKRKLSDKRMSKAVILKTTYSAYQDAWFTASNPRHYRHTVRIWLGIVWPHFLFWKLTCLIDIPFEQMFHLPIVQKTRIVFLKQRSSGGNGQPWNTQQNSVAGYCLRRNENATQPTSQPPKQYIIVPIELRYRPSVVAPSQESINSGEKKQKKTTQWLEVIQSFDGFAIKRAKISEEIISGVASPGDPPQRNSG